MNLKSVSTKEIEKMIKSLKSKNYTEYDWISTKLMKNITSSVYDCTVEDVE